MLRIVAFLLAVIAISAMAVWFANHPGTVAVDWLGRHLEAPVAVPLIAVAALVLAAALGYRLWRWGREVPAALRAGMTARGQRRGDQALVAGLTLAAAGDPAGTRKQARLAARHRPADDPLLLLLDFAGTRLGDDDEAVMTAAEALAAHPATALAGILGTIREGRARGRTGNFQALADSAGDIAPDSPVARALALELRVEAGDWDGAARALKALTSARGIAKSQAARARAMTWSAQAARLAGRDRDGALGLARKAHKACPGLPAAAAIAARLCVASGDTAGAGRILAAAWAEAPHPILARLFAELHDADTPTGRMARLERLCAANEDHFESRLALAEQAIEARLSGLARHHLTALLDRDPCARGHALAIRLAATDPDAADGPPLEHALSADQAPDAAWTCGNCQRRWAEWRLSCDHCQAVARMTWQLPPGRPRASHPADPEPMSRPVAEPAAAPQIDLYRSLAEGEARDAADRAGEATGTAPRSAEKSRSGPDSGR